MLYVVATPIGNLADISQRAAATLASVDVIAAEDTRRCRQLLSHLGISRPLVAYHDHSQPPRLQELLKILLSGRSVALVSDAGTPLVSDPGYALVRQAQALDIKVVPIPGPSAAIAALSVAGLPSDRFVFEGFLPARSAARIARLETLDTETRTLIFYESPRRILDLLRDLVTVFGETREAVLARELTKIHETLLPGTLQKLLDRVERDTEQQLGEIVVLVHGAAEATQQACSEADRVLRVLLSRLALKEALSCAIQICGRPRNELYRMALAIQRESDATE